MTDPIRLAICVAVLCGCLCCVAELVIVGGWVRVDGVVVEEPHFRVAEQRIEIDPEADLTQTEPVTILLHKPPGHRVAAGDPPAARLLTPTDLWAEDTAGIRPLKKHFAQLTLCAPLETDASGLVVFTQDC